MTRNIQRAAVFFVLSMIVAVNNGYCGTTYVTNNNDSDTGSLRTGITSANLHQGTTVAWTTGGGGDITLLSTLTDIGTDTTLDVSAATTAVRSKRSNSRAAFCADCCNIYESECD